MAILGLRGSGSFNVDDPRGERPQNWRETILYIHPNPAPLTAFLSRVEDEPTTDPQYNWFEQQTPQQVVFANAAYGAGITSIVVTTGTNLGVSVSDLVIFKPGHVILDQSTNEQMLVT